ncbi:hypothetical protein ACTXT7_016656 [Hymenolepis weldensis]
MIRRAASRPVEEPKPKPITSKILILQRMCDLPLGGRYTKDEIEKYINPLFRPEEMILKPNKDSLSIGSIHSHLKLDYRLKSIIDRNLVWPLHAVIRRLPNGDFGIIDNSRYGTYVMYKRVEGEVILDNGDIICFGYVNGDTTLPGQQLGPFYSDVKYIIPPSTGSTGSKGQSRDVEGVD